MSEIDDEIKRLYVNAMVIYSGSINYGIDWEITYDRIFSRKLSERVFKLIDLNYYDPDTNYDEDVKAFIQAFQEYMEENFDSDVMSKLQFEINQEEDSEYEEFSYDIPSSD